MTSESLKRALVLAFSAGTALSTPAFAGTIEVSAGGSIQEALDRARPGDTVAVRRGTYHESVVFRGSGVKLVSVDGVGAAHITSSGTPLFVQGGRDKEVRGFRLSAGKLGNGLQLGGSVSAFASGYTIVNNIVDTAGEDGIKAHQLDGSFIGNNEIVNAGTSHNANKDGGLDLVAVRGTDLVGNKVHRTGGNSCLMLKGGSTDNDIKGNDFGGCKNAVHVGGLTDDQFMAPGSNGREAYDNSITGNRLTSSSCAIFLFDGEQRRQDNEISGNVVSQGGGCSTVGGGGSVDTANAGAGGTYSRSSESDSGSWGQTSGMTAQLVSDTGGGGGLCDATLANAASAAASAFGVISSITGRATAGLQVAQQIQLLAQTMCHTEEVGLQSNQLSEQRRMTAGIGKNAVGSAGNVSGGVLDSLGLYGGADVGNRYQSGASAVMTPDESLAYQQALRARTDLARRNALVTAEKSVKAERAYSKLADDALSLSQSAQGQTAALQALAQLERAKEGASSARASSQVAMEHARLMADEEDRAAERLAQQRRDRLYRRLSPSDAASEVTSFKMFQ